MGRITFQIPADDDPSVRFAPGALDALVGTETKFNGQAATILTARVCDDPHFGEVTIESDAIGSGDAEGSLPAGSFSFRPS